MAVSRRHLLSQGPVIGALLKTAVLAARRRRPSEARVPSPTLHDTVPPRPGNLVRDYVAAVGGDPGWYRGVVPAHLFPQWGFPLLARTLEGIPYDLKRVLNGGCRIEIHHPLPAGERLQLSARLAEIDDNGRRAVLEQQLITGTASAPDAVEAWVYGIVPLPREEGEPRREKERPRVPGGARELGRFRLRPDDAVDFAFLTGDFNPVHWLPPYAKAAGFRSTILHGFATLAYAVEGLNRTIFSGDPSRLAAVDVKFVRPLLLPAELGLYVDDAGGLSVGAAPGGPAFLTGTYETRGS